MCGNSDSKSSESGGNNNGNGKKRARVPKRGPGVAKLEEMRREEENKDTRRRGTSLPSSSCFFLHPSNPHSYNNISNTALARHNQYPPHMMNQFPGSATASASSSSSLLPFGLHNPVEPPSNQSSYRNFTSWAPQEQRIVSIKRPYPSSLDNSVIPPTYSQVSPCSSHFSRLHQPPSNDSHSARSFASSNDCRRDANWGSHLELNSRKLISSDNAGPGHYNFLPFGSSHLPSPPMHALHYDANEVANQFHKERSMEDSHRRCESSGCDHKPFYNFLEVKDQVGLKETTHASNHDEGSDNIDLDLKL